jgi:hypothetical protein
LSQLTASLLQNDEAQSAMSRIVLFFDEAYSCVDKALCDYDAAYALLQSPADQIFSMYGSYLQTVRQQHPNYADGIGESPRPDQELVVALRRSSGHRRRAHACAEACTRLCGANTNHNDFHAGFTVSIGLPCHNTRIRNPPREFQL